MNEGDSRNEGTSAPTVYERKRSDTVTAVSVALQKIELMGHQASTLGELIKEVSVISNVARSTIRPYRNYEAYELVARFFANRAINPNQVPDEVADEFVLRRKLVLLRAESAELKRRLEDGLLTEDEHSRLARSQGDDEQIRQLFEALAQFLLRSQGTITVDTQKGRIEDRFPEVGFDRVICSDPIIKQFGRWLRTHPTLGRKEELFDDG